MTTTVSPVPPKAEEELAEQFENIAINKRYRKWLLKFKYLPLVATLNFLVCVFFLNSDPVPGNYYTNLIYYRHRLTVVTGTVQLPVRCS
jgi:hypothetical protein